MDTRKTIISIVVLILAVLLIIFLSSRNSQEQNIELPPEDNTGTPLVLSDYTLPAGFTMSIFASNVPGARVMEFDSKGRMLVSQTKEGQIAALTDTDNDGDADQTQVLVSGLRNPHGLAFNCPIDDRNLPCHLYVAESHQLIRYVYDAEVPSLGAKEVLTSIASSSADRHFTRSLLFLPSPNEDTLLISVGSSCDVCHEDSPERAAVLSYNVRTGVKEQYAKGLRNAVFMTLSPVSGKVFASEMGRDNLGDDIPPDEINIIEKGKNYGWPICYGKNIHDTQFDKNTYIRNPCMEPFETASFIDLQAHSAPLGLSFIPEEGWAEDMWYDLLVAYHGSWNRSVPTGYKIVRLKMDAQGNYGGTEDFITGWTSDKKKGRPVDIKVFSGGTVYISDDEKGGIYRVSRN